MKTKNRRRLKLSLITVVTAGLLGFGLKLLYWYITEGP